MTSTASSQARQRPAPSLCKIASAIIERAELPVHRKSTLKTRSVTPHHPLVQQAETFSPAGLPATRAVQRVLARAMQA
jgi:hypothetical protein